MAASVRQHGPEVGFKKNALYYLSVYVDEPPVKTPDGTFIPQRMAGVLHFEDETSRDIAFTMLAGRLAFWWWGITGDDLNVTKGTLLAFPVAVKDLELVGGELASLGKTLREEQARHLTFVKYRDNLTGNYDLSKCRHVTDEADKLILRTLGLGHLWGEVRLADSWLKKATTEGHFVTG